MSHEHETSKRLLSLDKALTETSQKYHLDQLKHTEELQHVKEQILRLQSDKRKEIEETSQMVKQVAQSLKGEISKEVVQ